MTTAQAAHFALLTGNDPVRVQFSVLGMNGLGSPFRAIRVRPGPPCQIAKPKSPIRAALAIANVQRELRSDKDHRFAITILFSRFSV